MDQNDKQAIEGLFGKLAQVERQSPSRDAQAEAFIAESVARQPGAPYFMAQTIVVQEHALNAAQERISQLEAEAEAARQAPAQGGGIFGRMFGGQPAQTPAANPAARRPQPAYPQQPMQPAPAQGGGGFLAGAAQTAMGVAGGMLLGNAIMGAFGGDEAQAAPAPVEEEEEARPEEEFEDDGGGDFGDEE